MFINGRVMDRSKILELLNNFTRNNCRKGNMDRNELDWREMYFDLEISRASVDFFKRNGDIMMKTIKLYQCRGQVNDIVAAIMAYDKVQEFTYSEVNKKADGTVVRNPDITQLLTAVAFGLKYSATNFKKLSLTVDFSATDDSDDVEELNDEHNITKGTANDNEDRALLFRFFFRALALNATLEDLDLAGSTLRDYTMTNLRFALCVNKTLVSLNLDGCRLDDEEVASLCETLQDHPALQRLSLQQNSVHDKSMANLAILLHLDKLVELDLSYLIRKSALQKKEEAAMEKDEQEKERTEQEKEEEEESETKSDDKTKKEGEKKSEDEEKPVEGETTLREEDKKEEDKKEKEKEVSVENRSLKLFHMAGNHLGDGAVETLLGIFNENSALEDLNLLGNRISDKGVDQIIRMLLETCRQLKCVNLSLNPFGREGSQRLLDTIQRTCYSMEECHIDQGTSSLLFGDQSYKDDIQEKIDYYCDLNTGGRRILNSEESTIPLGLWPYIFERSHQSFQYHDGGATMTDVIFCLLHTNPTIVMNL